MTLRRKRKGRKKNFGIIDSESDRESEPEDRDSGTNLENLIQPLISYKYDGEFKLKSSTLTDLSQILYTRNITDSNIFAPGWMSYHMDEKELNNQPGVITSEIRVKIVNNPLITQLENFNEQMASAWGCELVLQKMLGTLSNILGSCPKLYAMERGDKFHPNMFAEIYRISPAPSGNNLWKKLKDILDEHPSWARSRKNIAHIANFIRHFSRNNHEKAHKLGTGLITTNGENWGLGDNSIRKKWLEFTKKCYIYIKKRFYIINHLPDSFFFYCAITNHRASFNYTITVIIYTGLIQTGIWTKISRNKPKNSQMIKFLSET